MPPYCLSWTHVGYPLEEEQAQNGTKPEVFVTPPLTLCELSLHAVKHGHAPVEYLVHLGTALHNTCVPKRPGVGPRIQ
jgi:hypothetical protein